MAWWLLPALTGINHLLRSEAWARDRLRPFYGQAIRWEALPLHATVTIDTDGLLQAADPAIVPAVTLVMPFSALPKIATGGVDAVMAHLKIEGDAQLAHAVGDVARHLRWEPAEDLSRWVGDVAAERIVKTARSMHGLAKDTAQRAAENVAEYLLEEDPQLVRPRRVEQFGRGVQTVRDDVERLAKRIALLEARMVKRPW